MPTLIEPSLKYKESFLAAVREYQAEDLPNYRGMTPEELDRRFVDYLGNLKNASQGENLPVGYVPHTVWWLVEDDEYLGRVDLRHELNDFLKKEGGHIGYDIRPTQRGKGYGKLILKLGLAKAKELGFEKILITCDVSNLPSKKIIESNGGVLEDIQPTRPGQPDKARFWISLP